MALFNIFVNHHFSVEIYIQIVPHYYKYSYVQIKRFLLQARFLNALLKKF